MRLLNKIKIVRSNENYLQQWKLFRVVLDTFRMFKKNHNYFLIRKEPVRISLVVIKNERTKS